MCRPFQGSFCCRAFDVQVENFGAYEAGLLGASRDAGMMPYFAELNQGRRAGSPRAV